MLDVYALYLCQVHPNNVPGAILRESCMMKQSTEKVRNMTITGFDNGTSVFISTAYKACPETIHINKLREHVMV